MTTRSRSRWQLMPGVIGLILMLVTFSGERVLAQCWGDYCHTPPIGECIGEWCAENYYVGYIGYVEGCGWCERQFCERLEICLFGGGCSCQCWWDSWWAECTGYYS